ncbi:MAG: discoidin domain-containing protein [Clostridia bacterium]|nr:discoidin domain-containing protein [Clostridia bacterium]
MLKKTLSLMLAMLLAFFALAACNENTQTESNDFESVASEASKEESEVIMPEYWGFNDYNRVDIVGAPDEILSFPTTVTKVSDKKYSMACETEAGKLTITLEERPWGCFNLWSWRLIDKSGKEHIFAVGATDFEYVHIPITPKGTGVWSGGNHGNEAFLSLDLYNAESGEKIELGNGDSVTVNSLHIIEKTKLLWFPDDNGDSIGDYNNKSMSYTDDDVYAEMTRKYTFTGPQVKLNVDYKYVKDVQHNRSYTCMLPINKKYGLWCEMYNNDGKLLRTIETLKVGAADYSGPSNSNNKASRAVIYGYVDPRYQFDVRVTTFEDSLDQNRGDYKTAYWDMNTTDNKLYFTKFSNSEKRLLKAGTEFHTECFWLFKFVEDAEMPEISEPDEVKPEDITLEGTNIALGKEYTLSGLLGSGYGNYTASLTDGKATETLTYDNNWFSFYNNSSLPAEQLNVEDGIGYAIIDLGEKKNISGVRVHLCNGGTAGINAPYSATVYVSDDGKNFTEAAKLTIASDAKAIYWTGAELENISARYVKFSFKPNGPFVFINELEVYSK